MTRKGMEYCADLKKFGDIVIGKELVFSLV
jgi:hypothetical protein